MDQLKKLFATLTLRQKIGIGAVLILLGAGLSTFLHWNRERNFKPLFTGMSPEDAATIVQKLKESGSTYRIIDNGSSVLVPQERVNELRLEMAGAGLPKTGRIGFELFDKTNLGITDFTEKVNYRRALEGELERSIRTLAEVQEARVHVTFPKESLFLDSKEPAKASVLVRLRPGAHLSAQNVVAVTNLIASAVEGLTPEFVSVLDMQGNLLSKPRKNNLDGSEPSDAILDYKHQVERDLTSKVQSTLDPLLGEARFRVAVSADCDLSTSEQSDEVFDPTHSVMASSQKTEDVSGASQVAGVPGTPSNLPRSQPARPVVPGSNTSRRTENVSYQNSHTIKHTKTPQGIVRRISASLLLDNEVQWQGTGKDRKRVLVAPTPEKMKAIRDVVAGVLGIVTERGDQLVIESLPFEQTLAEGQTDVSGPQTTPAATKLDFKDLLKDKRVWIGAGAGIILLAALVFLLLRKKSKKSVSVEGPKAALSAGAEGAVKDGVPEIEAPPVFEIKAFELPPMTQKLEGLRAHAKEQVRKDPAMVANVIRAWLNDD
jgi:flagellar M-ring protein FliF